MKNNLMKTTIGIATCVAAAGLAYAAVDFDAASGTGFVGKGDVQNALGLSNKELQGSNISFSVLSTEVREFSWTCKNTNNSNLRLRAATTTTTVDGVLASVERVRNQITGFILTGLGDSESSTVLDGEFQINQCPSGTNWTLLVEAGDGEVISSSGGLWVTDGNTTAELGSEVVPDPT
jgi:hypothetical protein